MKADARPNQIDFSQFDNLASALSQAQSEMPKAVLDCKNPHFNSKYASLESIWDACRKPLTKYGLSVVQGIVPHDKWDIALETKMLYKAESISFSCPLLVDRKNMQGLGSAITYAKRYSLAMMVGVVDSEDDDGNASVKAEPRASSAAPTKKPVKEVNPKSSTEYIIDFGKFKGKTFNECKADELENYAMFLAKGIDESKQAGKSASSYSINFLNKYEQHLASLGGELDNGEITARQTTKGPRNRETINNGPNNNSNFGDSEIPGYDDIPF